MDNKEQNYSVNAEQIEKIFFPFSYHERRKLAERNPPRFVYYTSAETAVNIIRNKEIWMRSTMTMNDYAEIEYGFNCLNEAIKSPFGETFRATLNELHPNIAQECIDLFNQWYPGIRRDTFITCVSEHMDDEDVHGRLSMWRAYGGRDGIALVINGTPMFSDSKALAAYSAPVAYFEPSDSISYLAQITQSMLENKGLLSQLKRDDIKASIFEVFRTSVLCTKHPGFREEREWRIYANPSIQNSEHLKQHIAVVRGTPQVILRLPFKNVPDEGLNNMEIHELIDRVIIGPCEFPQVTYRAFHQLLKEAGVREPHDRISVSGIPLRHF